MQLVFDAMDQHAHKRQSAAHLAPPHRKHGVWALGLEQVRFVERTLARYGARGEDLFDIRQEVLLVAHRALGGFRGEASLETWLYRICIREMTKHRRKRRQIEQLKESYALSSSAPATLLDTPARENEARLVWALGELGEAKRAALELYALEGLSMREVATELGCPVQTAYSRVHAARMDVALLLTDGGADAAMAAWQPARRRHGACGESERDGNH